PVLFSFYASLPPPAPPPFPTRRSSDLGGPPGWPTGGFGDAIAFDEADRLYVTWHSIAFNWASASVFVANSTSPDSGFESASFTTDRKSTRLNSSHDQISYAVFCLKKKK